VLTFLAIGLSFAVVVLTILRLTFLRARGRLEAANFSMTFAMGMSLGILVFFYVNLAEVLISKRDPILASLGLLIAGLILGLGYLVGRIVYGLFERILFKAPNGK